MKNNKIILIVGLPYFGKKIAEELSEFDAEFKYIYIDLNDRFVLKLKYIYYLFKCNSVYVISGTVKKSKSIQMAMLLKRKIFMHWVGSDVLAAKKNYLAEEVYEPYKNHIINFCESSWIKDELACIDINADIVHFASFNEKDITDTPIPSTFSILSYVGRNRERFYGMDNLIKLANDYPQIEIRIAGISKYSMNLPPNIKLLGWVTNMNEEYKKCTLYLRLPEHDGLAFSVLEALSHSRYVGYSFPFIQTIHINGYLSLKLLVAELISKHKNQNLSKNINGYEFIKENFIRSKVLSVLKMRLTN